MFYKTYRFVMFSGCISQLKISGNNERISPGLVANKVGVTGCETCAVNPCQNGGVCQGKLVKQGFRLSIAEIKFDAFISVHVRHDNLKFQSIVKSRPSVNNNKDIYCPN